MSSTSSQHVIDFSNEPIGVTERRLADLPDRVVEGDPHHVSQTRFESPDGALIPGRGPARRANGAPSRPICIQPLIGE